MRSSLTAKHVVTRFAEPFCNNTELLHINAERGIAQARNTARLGKVFLLNKKHLVVLLLAGVSYQIDKKH